MDMFLIFVLYDNLYVSEIVKQYIVRIVYEYLYLQFDQISRKQFIKSSSNLIGYEIIMMTKPVDNSRLHRR